MNLMTGQRVVVIGGSSGIGLATARAVVAHGTEVVIAARTVAKLASAANEIGRSVAWEQLDVSQEEQVNRHSPS